MVVLPRRTLSWEVLWVLAFFSSGLTTPEGRTFLAKQLPNNSSTALRLPSNKYSTTSSANNYATTELSNETPITGEILPSYSASPEAVDANGSSKLLNSRLAFMHRPRGRPSSTSDNLTSVEILNPVSTVFLGCNSTTTERLNVEVTSTEPPADHPNSTEHSAALPISTNMQSKDFHTSVTEKLRHRFIDEQNNSNQNKKELSLLNAFGSVPSNSSTAEAVIKPAKRSFHIVPPSIVAQQNGTEKVSSRSIREAYEVNPPYETGESDNGLSDNIMLPSDAKERLVKWQQPDDVRSNAVGLEPENQIFPSGEQKTIYARKLEYTLPSTYAVLFKKVYSSKQVSSNFLDDEMPKQQTVTIPWFVEERDSDHIGKIHSKRTSTENENGVKEGGQTEQTIAKSSASGKLETTLRPYFDTQNGNEYASSDDEDPWWDWQFENEIDSVSERKAKKGKKALQRKETRQTRNNSDRERRNDVPLGVSALHVNDHLAQESKTSLNPRKDSSEQRTLRTTGSREPIVQLLKNSGVRKYNSSTPLTQLPSESSRNVEHLPSLRTESLISTDMLTDSSLHDIRLKMKNQLKIDNAKLNLNSIYSNEAGKSSIQEKEESGSRASRNPLVVSKRAGFKTEKAQNFRREKIAGNPLHTSTEEVKRFEPRHDRYSRINEQDNNAKKIREQEFTPPREVPNDSKPVREMSSYSYVPRLDGSAENVLDDKDYDQGENTVSHADQSVRNDVSQTEYANSPYLEEEAESESSQRRMVPIEYSRRPQASSRNYSNRKESDDGNISRELSLGSPTISNSKVRNFSNERSKKPSDRKGTERVAPHAGHAFARSKENIRRNEYDTEFVDRHQESRSSPKNSGDEEATRYEEYDLYPVYDSNYHTDSEDYPVVLDDLNEVDDITFESKRQRPQTKPIDRTHDDRRSSSRSREESREMKYDPKAPYDGKTDQSHAHSPRNHHNNKAKDQSSDSQKQSSQPARDDRARNTPTLFDHAMQVAAATGKKLISPLLYLPDTQDFPEFESFGNFAKFKQE